MPAAVGGRQHPQRPEAASGHHQRVRELVGRIFGSLPASARALLAGIAGLAVVGTLFVVVVFPLLENTGPTGAEVAGVFPRGATVGKPLVLDMEITSTGDRTIHPICVRATFDRPVDFQNVDFDGIETINANGQMACGGMLATQESIAIVLTVVPRAAGPVDASIVPTQGNQTIGIPLTGSFQVSSR